MRESELNSQISEMCSVLGLRCYHVYNSKRGYVSSRGFPDWVIWGPKGALFRECKTESGELTREQKIAGYSMREAGLDWDVWRPSDWWAGLIGKQLRSICA